MNGLVKMSIAALSSLPAVAAPLKPGDVLHGFTVKSVDEIKEIDARMVRMEYTKNGAELVWLDRDEDNFTFAIAFRTLPSDDTGVAHIIEHSLLCGSDKYPVKEPFVDLLKSSFATFLNAWTASDSTAYPVCSRNPRDFLNLIDVYMDAVFHPLSVKNPLAFRQEGWHYELKDGELKRNGIVYSEMQGAFSDANRVLFRELARLLYPDTAYRYVSGGDPDSIPELTFEKYCSFYRRFYQPSNARIFLDGKVDLDAVLAKLDGFLAPYGRSKVEPGAIFQRPVSGAKTVEYEIGADESPDGKYLLGDAWGFARYNEIEKILAADILASALAENNESPLKKVLLERGLCEDFGLDVYDGANCSIFYVARNVKKENVAELRRVVRETLASIAEKGLDHERLSALLDKAEYLRRERDSGTTPLGLDYFMSALGQWLYGGDPADAFRVDAIFASLRRKIAEGGFEKLMREVLINNPHHVEVTLEPSPTLNHRRAEARKAELKRILASWSKEEVERVKADCRALEAYQTTPDRPEDTAKLPMLTLADVPAEGYFTACSDERIEGVRVLRPHAGAVGIAHLGLIFDVSDLPTSDLIDLPMLAVCLGELATANMSVEQLRNAMDAGLGHFNTSFSPSIHPSERIDQVNVHFVVSASALDSKLDQVERLIPEILLGTKFDDERAVGDLLKQVRTSKELSTKGLSGREYPFIRASAQFSAFGLVKETASGFTQLRRLQALCASYEKEGAAYRRRLAELAKKVFTRSRLTVSVTDNEPAAWAVKMAKLMPEGPAMGAPAARELLPRRSEGFRIPANIAFAARATAPQPEFRSGQTVVAARILSLDYLWSEIRVKGGAYGSGFRYPRHGVAGWLSWNDPKPGRSLEVYAASGKALREFADGKAPIDRFIISTIAGTEPYMSVRAKASDGTASVLEGYTREKARRRRAEMLATTRDDLRAVAAKLDGMLPLTTICVLGGDQTLKACGDKLDKIEDVVVDTKGSAK